MQNFLLFSLFFLVSSATIEFGKETSYSPDNGAFEFTYDGNGAVLIYVTCGSSNNMMLSYSYGRYNSGSTSINKPGEGLILDPTSESNYKLILTNPRQESGVIWVNPETNEIEVDLSKKYEIKIPFIKEHIYQSQDRLSQITYAIKNAAKDITFKFEYTEKVDAFGDELTSPNPFEICHGNECKGDIKTYEFKKGESYKIHVKMQDIKDDEEDPYSYYVIPPFSFADENYKESSSNYSLDLRFHLLGIFLYLLLL